MAALTPSLLQPPPPVVPPPPPAPAPSGPLTPQSDVLNYMRCTSEGAADYDCVEDEAKFSRYCNAIKSKCACFNNQDNAALACSDVPRIVRSVVGPPGPPGPETTAVGWQWATIVFAILFVLLLLGLGLFFFLRNRRSGSGAGGFI